MLLRYYLESGLAAMDADADVLTDEKGRTSKTAEALADTYVTPASGR